jgi:hypothetical protein
MEKDAGIPFDGGAYMAVVVAAFGGVSVHTSKTKKAEMHPATILLLVVPLFVVQMTMIIALSLDMDVMAGVIDYSEEDEMKRTRVLTLKCLMICVVQLMGFGLMLSNIRFAMFVVNPLTWIEMAHPSLEEWLGELDNKTNKVEVDASKTRWLGWAYHPLFLGLPCVIALVCRFCVSYFVTVSSMSIIFSSSSMTQTIFNSLALTFVNDLNSIYWDFITTILNLGKLDEFVFKERIDIIHKMKLASKYGINAYEGTESQPEGKDSQLIPVSSMRASVTTKEQVPFSDRVNAVEQVLQKTTQSWFSQRNLASVITLCPWLSRGGGFRRSQDAFSFIVLAVIYLQQVFIVCYALTTNVLPVARDICTMWRWDKGYTFVFKTAGPLLIRFLDAVTLVHMDLTGEVSRIPEYGCRKNDGKVGMYYRMQNSDRVRLAFGGKYNFVNSTLDSSKKTYIVDTIEESDSPWTLLFWLCFVCVVMLAIVPQFSAVRDQFEALCHKCCKKGQGSPDMQDDEFAPDEADPPVPRSEYNSLLKDFEKLKAVSVPRSDYNNLLNDFEKLKAVFLKKFPEEEGALSK